MKGFYVTLTAEGTVYGRQNTPADFLTPSPWLQSLQGEWECALVEISMECEYMPTRSDRLYMCSDFVEESYIKGSKYPLLRNVETRGQKKKYLTEQYTDQRYMRVQAVWRDVVRFYVLDEELQPVTISADKKLHCVLHFKPRT